MSMAILHKIAQTDINRRINNLWAIHTKKYSAIKEGKKQTTEPCKNMDEYQKLYIEEKKPTT